MILKTRHYWTFVNMKDNIKMSLQRLVNELNVQINFILVLHVPDSVNHITSSKLLRSTEKTVALILTSSGTIALIREKQMTFFTIYTFYINRN